jgi:hypothetical protein
MVLCHKLVQMPLLQRQAHSVSMRSPVNLAQAARDRVAPIHILQLNHRKHRNHHHPFRVNSVFNAPAQIASSATRLVE